MTTVVRLGDSSVSRESVVTVPDHVVYRQFPTETVALNLNTGQYHGLNPTAGRFLDALGAEATVGDAADVLAEEFGQPLAEIEADICEFCDALTARGLIELG